MTLNVHQCSVVSHSAKLFPKAVRIKEKKISVPLRKAFCPIPCYLIVKMQSSSDKTVAPAASMPISSTAARLAVASTSYVVFKGSF